MAFLWVCSTTDMVEDLDKLFVRVGLEGGEQFLPPLLGSDVAFVFTLPRADGGAELVDLGFEVGSYFGYGWIRRVLDGSDGLFFVDIYWLFVLHKI